MNSGYVLWFAALVIVAGTALLWLAIGSVPELPAEPEAEADPGLAGESEGVADPGLAGESWATRAPGPAPEADSAIISEPLSEPGPGSEPAGEDWIARPG
ncbi:MAG TPA: hypothetical protein VF302_00390 [Candidatus Limnocylindrales bacterium]